MVQVLNYCWGHSQLLLLNLFPTTTSYKPISVIFTIGAARTNENSLPALGTSSFGVAWLVSMASDRFGAS